MSYLAEQSNKKKEYYAIVAKWYDMNRYDVTCTSCNKKGTMKKNGFNKRLTPPQPQYQCTACKKIVGTQTMKNSIEAISEDQYEVDSSSSSSEEEQDEIMQDIKEDDKAIEDNKDINWKQELLSLMKRVEENEKTQKKMHETTVQLLQKISDLQEQNNDLQEENEELKNIIKQMENKQKNKQKNEQKNTQKNETIITLDKSPIQEEEAIIITETTEKDLPPTAPLSTKDFPLLPTATSFIPRYNTNNIWAKKKKHQFYRKNNPTKKQLELAARTFDEKKEDNNFINVYIVDNLVK